VHANLAMMLIIGVIRRLAAAVALACWTAGLAVVSLHKTPWLPPGTVATFDVAGLVLHWVVRLFAAYLLAATLLEVVAATTPWLRRSADLVGIRAVHGALAAVLSAVLSAGTPAVAQSRDATMVQLTSDDDHHEPTRAARPAVAADVRDTRAPARWVVKPGDHFWSIAEQLTPNDGEVGATWRHLVEINRSRLVDRSNPDLLIPGQVLIVSPGT